MQEHEGQKISFSDFWKSIKIATRIIKIVWPGNQKIMLALAFIYLLFSLNPFIFSGSYGFLINNVVQSVSIGAPSPSFWFSLIVFALAGLMVSIILPLIDYFTRILTSHINERMEHVLLNAQAGLDFSVREDPKNANIFNSVNENSWRMKETVNRQYFLIQNIVEVAVASFILLFANWWLFIIVLLGTIPELVVELRHGRHVWGIYGARSELRRRFWDLKGCFDNYTHLFDVKLFQSAQYFIGTIGDILKRFIIDERKLEKRKLRSYLLVRVLAQSVIVFAAVWFILKVIHGEMPVGNLIFIIASLDILRRALSSFFKNIGQQYGDSFFVVEILKLIDMKPVLPREENPAVLSSAETPEIIFDHVTFKYPQSETPILKDFSLRIKPGDRVALIGVNGAGKTTFVKLLLRFYDPTEGRILINGHDLRSLDLESWYSLIGVLFQDYANYHLLTKDVIAVGRTSKIPDIEKVKESAKAAEADTFIAEWEKNYDQQLGSWVGGIEPSIGQWQKLALARTFYRDPRILILDEPTSSIDAEAEAKIFEKLEALPKDRTIIMISHRFSTVRQADQIVVIEGGKIKEHGKHADLLKKKGTYARLFKLQAKGYK